LHGQSRNASLVQLQGHSCSCLALVPRIGGVAQGSAVPLRDPLGCLRAEPEHGKAEIREMRFGSRRLRLLEMHGSAGTWREAKINPESISLQVPPEPPTSAPALAPFHSSSLSFESSKSIGIAPGMPL